MPELPALRTLFAELVAEPSVSSADPALDQPNLGVVSRVAEWAGSAGFRCEVMPVPGRPGKANLIAIKGEGPGGLVLSGHADTVPCQPQQWRSDPFRLEERDDCLHGLGICDMKGFIALALEAGAAVDARTLREPLILLVTADEESGMDGARALLAAGRPRARRAVIGEPTGLRPIRAHKGVLMESLRIEGRAGHSSRPDLGASAIDGLHRLLDTLADWRAELATRRGAGEYALDHPTLNFGVIAGGEAPNVIAPHGRLDIDLRFPAGHTLESLRAELHRRASAAALPAGCHLSFAPLFDGIPAFSTPDDGELVRACEALSGHAAGAVEFATEGPYLSGLGMETVIFGPGDISVAHQPDEYLPLAHIEPARAALRGLIQRFCVDAEPATAHRP